MNLCLLFLDEPHQLIVLLNGFERLHIDSLARGTRAVNHACDAPLKLRAHRNHEALTANGNDVVLRRVFRGELAQRRAQAFLDKFLLALLLAADAIQLGRGVVGERAVGLNLALDGFGKRPQAGGERRRKFGKSRQFADKPHRWLAQERLPCGDVVGEARDALKFGCIQRRAGNLRLGR